MKKTLLVTCLLASLSPAAFSYDLEWTSPVDGSLDDATQWNPSAEPASADRLFFSATGDYKATSTKDLSVAQITLNANSGTVEFALGAHHLQSGLTIANQDVNWTSGRLSTNLQIANGTSDVSFAFTGSGSQFTGTAASVGRSNVAAAGSNNSFTLSDGASFTSSGSVIVGANDVNTGFAANGNTLKISGAGTTLHAGGGIIVGNLGSAVTGASASGNSLIIENGAHVTAASLNIGRRSAGTLATATNNKVTITGTSTASTLLTLSGSVSVGAVGGGNQLIVGKFATVDAKGGNTAVNSRAGNALLVQGGVYDAAGRKITAYNLATVSVEQGGSITAQTLDLQGATFITKDDSSATFDSLVMNGTGVFEFTVGSGATHGLVTVSGSSALNGTLRVTFSDSFSPTAGQDFRLFNFGEVEGTFSNLVLPELALNLKWDTTQLYSTGVISVIPEPSSASLITGGLIFALAGYRMARGK